MQTISINDCNDTLYFLGRANYTCQICNSNWERSPGFYQNGYLIKVDNKGEYISSNLQVICGLCTTAARHGFGSRDVPAPITAFKGRLIVITGPMFAEKSGTTEALYNNYKVITDKFVWVKPDIDDIEEGFTRTHNKKKIKAFTISADRPDRSLESLLHYDIVVFDEAQFFSERLIYVIHQLMFNGTIVIVNGLKLTAKRDLFGVMHYLLAEADEIKSLKAVCNKCNKIDRATRTKSYQSLPSVSTGGAEAYFAVCPKCDEGL